MISPYEVRKLIEDFYDIQHLRIELFNRLVAWAKQNQDSIIEKISQDMSETPIGDASQDAFETQVKSASQCIYESHLIDASQNMNESHLENASQEPFEIHKGYASHGGSETYSQNASHRRYETQGEDAIQLLKSKKYAEFVKTYILTHKLEFDEIQDLLWLFEKLYETEKELKKRLDYFSRNHPLRENFLNHVKGIGPIFASGLIAWLAEPIKKAPHVSSIWKYCGLAPGQKRAKGKKLGYNARLKTFLWKIGESFIKYKCFGRKLYLKFKEECRQKHPDWTKMHCHNWAKRKVVKLFLSALWVKWRKMNNLPVTKPYPIEHLGHDESQIIRPEDWMEKEGGG